MRINKPFTTIVVLALVVGGIAFLEMQSSERTGGGGGMEVELPSGVNGSGGTGGEVEETPPRIQEKLGRYDRAHEISNPAGFVNTDGVSLNDMVGDKVVLVDFWTYSCINCQRTLPYLTAWDQKYRDDGLVIVGVHSPEFEFEKKQENVEDAVERFGIEYPVVMDNSFSTWAAYDNRYWPQKYLVGVDGFVRYEHIGEGGYAETEEKIQELLKERARVVGENVSADLDSEPVDPGAEGADFGGITTPEIYFGTQRNTDLANGEKNRMGEQELTVPEEPVKDLLYLGGRWEFQPQYAESLEPGAEIVLKYQAKEVNMVASSPEPVELSVEVDGEPVDGMAGDDVTDGSVAVQEERLYNLVSGDDYSTHTLRLTVEEPGLKAFTFTFG